MITPKFGSMVQKGKLALCAFALERQLKRVDFPDGESDDAALQCHVGSVLLG